MCISPTSGRSGVTVTEDNDNQDGGYRTTNPNELCLDESASGIGSYFRQKTSAEAPAALLGPPPSCPTRHSRGHGIRKLQKCLSTSVTNYEVTLAIDHHHHPGQASLIDNRNLSTPMTSQSILSSARQYSSFGIFHNKKNIQLFFIVANLSISCLSQLFLFYLNSLNVYRKIQF